MLVNETNSGLLLHYSFGIFFLLVYLCNRLQWQCFCISKPQTLARVHHLFTCFLFYHSSTAFTRRKALFVPGPAQNRRKFPFYSTPGSIPPPYSAQTNSISTPYVRPDIDLSLMGLRHTIFTSRSLISHFKSASSRRVNTRNAALSNCIS